MNTPRLETERLVLRRFEPSDLQAFFQIFSDGEVNRFLPWFPVRDLEEAQAFYQQRYAPVYAKAQGYAYAICRKEDNVPIGYVNGETEGARDFGYGLRKEFWPGHRHRGLPGGAGPDEGGRRALCHRHPR